MLLTRAAADIGNLSDSPQPTPASFGVFISCAAMLKALILVIQSIA